MGRGRRKEHHLHDIAAVLSKRTSQPSPYLDLYVPVPKGNGSATAAAIVIRQILDRCATTGVSHVALTHTVYGSPRLAEDQASCTLHKLANDAATYKTIRNKTPTVLYRLHAVVENLSDIEPYALAYTVKPAEGSSLGLLHDLQSGYDIISIAPRNDAVFQAACFSATSAEIITLDYTAGRGGYQLPFKITRSNVKAAIARNAVFEIPYASSLLNRNQRKGLIQTCHLLQSASLGLRPKVIVSSGERFVAGSNQDLGAMALRMPGDVINLMAVLGWHTRNAVDALNADGAFAVNQGQRRRFGASIMLNVSCQDEFTAKGEHRIAEETSTPVHPRGKLTVVEERNGQQRADDVGEDGFISI
jgi:RNase P/RNase MRP subunit p30